MGSAIGDAVAFDARRASTARENGIRIAVLPDPCQMRGTEAVGVVLMTASFDGAELNPGALCWHDATHSIRDGVDE
jgi:hypothetical protein